MKLSPEITAALEAYRPEIAAQFDRIVRSQFAVMVEKFGPTLRGIYNDRLGKTYRETVSGFVVGTKEKTLDDEKLAKGAGEYAQAVTDEWAGKILAKLGEVDSATVDRMTGMRFQISGSRAGKRICIEQTMIVNVSPKGTVFNQFPARIYVDGKFTSAAAYKRAFA